MKKILVVILATLFVASMITPVFAANAGDKLARGLVNFATGWLELPQKIADTSKESNAFVGVTYGAVKGVGYGAARMGTGAFDAVTFVVPPYDKPIMEPKYAFTK